MRTGVPVLPPTKIYCQLQSLRLSAHIIDAVAAAVYCWVHIMPLLFVQRGAVERMTREKVLKVMWSLILVDKWQGRPVVHMDGRTSDNCIGDTERDISTDTLKKSMFKHYYTIHKSSWDKLPDTPIENCWIFCFVGWIVFIILSVKIKMLGTSQRLQISLVSLVGLLLWHWAHLVHVHFKKDFLLTFAEHTQGTRHDISSFILSIF